jgi:fructose-bisphosphate aldolase class I
MKNHISGVILYDETLRQKAKDGTTLVDVIKASGSIPGIKVDTGAKPLAGPTSKIETVTEGLDGLRERLAEYHKIGARFAKWRAVIAIADKCPSYNAISANAHALARYAALCQEAGIVPIVEPEVLMDGEHSKHDIDTCYEVTEWVLKETFQQLYYANVKLEGIVLKPNMIVPGQKCAKQASAQEVAEKTIKCLKACVPSTVPGIAFLSGGQSDEAATEHLSLMNQMGPHPWAVTFSYGRALQSAALKAWGGKAENVTAGQRAFSHRAKLTGLAALGKWDKSLEKAA